MPRVAAAARTRASITARVDAAHAKGKRQVLAHALVRVERVALKHHGEVAALGRNAGYVSAVDEDLAGGRRLETGDEAKHGALAAAGRSDQNEQLPVADLDRHVARGGVTVWIALVDLLQAYRRHVSPSRRPT